MNKLIGNYIFFGLICALLFSCSKNEGGVSPYKETGDYSLLSEFDTIRSYPDGGGIFIISIKKEQNFAGRVSLSVEADPMLKANLTKTILQLNDTVAEIEIHPELNASLKNYQIRIIASHAGVNKSKDLIVQMYDWGPANVEDAIPKRNEFTKWIQDNYPLYSLAFGQVLATYETYPGILIVEHFTFLTTIYELRLCYHVMIPPDDWSMIRIRNRNMPEAEFAAKRETDGSIKEIDVSEYPLMFGY